MSMQELLGSMDRRGTTIFDDPSMRLPTRPSQPADRGKLFEDLGTTDFVTFAPTKNASRNKSAASSSRLTTDVNNSINSNDEMDFLSPQKAEDDGLVPPRKKAKAKDHVIINSERNDYHPKKENTTTTRPKPRPVGINSKRPTMNSQKLEPSHALSDSFQTASEITRRAESPVVSHQLDDHSDSDVVTGKKKAKSTFPVSPIVRKDSPPVKENTSTFPVIPPLSPVRSSPFPLSPPSPSPPVEKTKEKISTFPLSPPIRNPTSGNCFDDVPSTSGKAKGKANADVKSGIIKFHNLSDSDDDDELALKSDDDIRTRGKGNLRPFPLSKQMLESIGSGESPCRKRLSDGADGGERKKRREGDDKFDVDTGMESLGIGDDEGDELVFLDPNINPKDLCPYCDTLLPPNPTPLLLKLLATAKSASIPDARPTNPLGRKATMTVYVGLCQRHRFESVWLPKAKKKGWKEVIDWEGLKGRIEAMKDVLTGILKDVDDRGYDEGGQVQEEDSDEDDDEEEKERERMQDKKDKKAGKGPRKRCIFWNELMKEVKQKGIRGVVGVRGQFTNFEKLQPGYYGEQGSAIIHQTLYTLFPPASVNPKLTHPLTPAEFHQRILVPQVGLLLIREDLDSSIKKALKTMRDSTSYGVAMFPEDGDGDGVGAEWKGGRLREDMMGVADKIALERARKRRKELEVEEREENEAFEKQLAEAERTAEEGKVQKEQHKGKRKIGKREPSRKIGTDASNIERLGGLKAKRAGLQTPSIAVSVREAEPATESVTTTRPRPRPRPKPVSKSNSELQPALKGQFSSTKPHEPEAPPRYTPSQQSSDSDDEFPRPSPRLLKRASSTAEDSDAPRTSTPPHVKGKQRKPTSVDISLSQGTTTSDATSEVGTARTKVKRRTIKNVTNNEVIPVTLPLVQQGDQRRKDIVGDDDTPKAKKVGRGTSVLSTTTNSYPMARNRTALKANDDGWRFRMSPVLSISEDSDIDDRPCSDRFKWLLDDSSQDQ